MNGGDDHGHARHRAHDLRLHEREHVKSGRGSQTRPSAHDRAR